MSPADRIARIDTYLFDKLLPLWAENGIDWEKGGSQERLERDLSPVETGFKRLMVQCRQLFVYSYAFELTGNPQFEKVAHHLFDFIKIAYPDETNGGWYFSVKPDGSAPFDDKKDAYGHAFVFFSMAFYYRTFKVEEAVELAKTTLTTIQSKMRQAPDGYAESTTPEWEPHPAIRRQNPHMHLLEGFILMHEVSGDPAFGNAADEVMRLLRERFFHAETHTLGEFFTDDWAIHAEDGQITEAGHHFEWYWLIHRYNQSTALQGDDSLEEQLYAWAVKYGIDPEFGGIYDQVSKAGEVLVDSKRIWPVTECLKAAAVRYELGKDPKDLALLDEMTDFIFKTYLNEETGLWFEYVERDGTPQVKDLPGSTGYHIFLGLTEARRLYKQLV